LDEHDLGIRAWYVRDAVDTTAFVVSRSMSPWSREGRRDFAAAQEAADAAALALLAEAYLDRAIVGVLYAPFMPPRSRR
jgi:hypothetical protein